MIKKDYYIVGCGGVCTYFIPAFLKTLHHTKELKGTKVTLIDGDTIEEKNYERQVFSEGKSGTNKAEVLADDYASRHENVQLEIYPEYIDFSYPIEMRSMVIAFVDNHPARKDILSLVDRHEGEVIIAANGRLGASAYYYSYKWKGTALDPRVRYPELLTVERGSPIHAAGCNTEEHLDNSPQTAVANSLAAGHALLLWAFWTTEVLEYDEKESFSHFPVEFNNTEALTNTIRVRDIQK